MFHKDQNLLFLDVKVVTCSGKNDIETMPDGTLKIHLKSLPEGGKANKELVSLLSKKLKLPQFSFLITSGMTTKNKRIKIASSDSKEEIIKKLTSNVKI